MDYMFVVFYWLRYVDLVRVVNEARSYFDLSLKVAAMVRENVIV